MVRRFWAAGRMLSGQEVVRWLRGGRVIRRAPSRLEIDENAKRHEVARRVLIGQRVLLV